VFSVQWEQSIFWVVFDENKFHIRKLHIVETELHVGNKYCKVLENWRVS
jgi:hypothetical protein